MRLYLPGKHIGSDRLSTRRAILVVAAANALLWSAVAFLTLTALGAWQ